MKKKWIKLFATLFVCTTLSLGFTACKDEGNNSSSSNSTNTEQGSSSGSGASSENNSEDDSSSSAPDSSSGDSSSEQTHTHNYTAVTTAPTCTEQGFTIYTCACGDEYIADYVNALNHDYGVVIYTWNENQCTATRVCTHDNTHVETETVTAEYIKDTDATCTVPEKGHYIATFTNGVFETQTTVSNSVENGSKLEHTHSALKHSDTEHWYECVCGDKKDVEGHTPSAPATETTDQICTECERVLVPSLGHVHTLHLTKVNAKEQSCIETGNIEYYICSCEKWFTDNTATTEIEDKTSVIIAKDKHEYTELKNNETQHWYECVCGDKDGEEGHKGGTATCTKLAVCSICSESYGELEEHNHTELKHNNEQHWYECICGAYETKENHKGGTATCTQKAKCSVCSEEYGEANGHDYDSVATAPTCTERGYTTYTCHCGDSYIDDYVDELGHILTYHEATSADCSTVGNIEYWSCSSCSNNFSDSNGETIVSEVTIEARHIVQYYESVNDPNYAWAHNEAILVSTNKEHGSSSTYTIKALSDFDFVFKHKTSSESGYDKLIIKLNSSQILALSGVKSSWTEVTQSLKTGDVLTFTYSKDGSASSGDDCVYIEILTSEGYDCTDVSQVQALCETDIYCTACNTLLVEHIGHNYVNHNAQEPTCTEVGWQEYTSCSRCDYTTYVEIEETGHTYGEWVTDIAPTCTESGTKHRDCINCDYVATGTISSTGHTYGEWVTDIDPTCTESGTKHRDCINCDYVATGTISSTGHTYGDWVIDRDSTCSTFGEQHKICSVCEYSSSGTILLKEHTFVEGTCLVCASLEGSVGLKYVYGYGGVYLDGIGTCADTNIIVASSYNGYPVTSIKAEAFKNDANIVSVILPNTIKTIGDNAFYNCDSLKNVVISEGTTSIGEYAFASCALQQITIPSSIISIDSCAFIYSGIERVNYTGTIDQWAQIAFYGKESNPFLGDTFFYINNKLVTKIQLENATKISAYAFVDCDSLTSVVIGDDVTNIGDCAFEDCDLLVNVAIGNDVTGIGASAFRSCDSLTSVVIGDDVTNIGNCAFEYCDLLTSITIGDGVTSIGSSAFSGCKSLTKLYYLGTIDKWAELGLAAGLSTSYDLYINGQLTTETILTTAIKISNYAFYNCESISSIIIPEGVTSIGNFAFYNCVALTDIEIPNSVTSIGNYAFYNCESLISITIPDGVTSIGSNAFYNCVSLISMTIGNGITSMSSSYLSECKSLTKINYLGTLDKWVELGLATGLSTGYDLYINGRLVTEAVLTTAIKIANEAFDDCKSLSSITIGDSVTSIGEYAFNNCTSLTSITIGNGVTSIGADAFRKCTYLTSIIIPSSVTSIASSAFFGCARLTNIKVAEDNLNYKDIDGNLYSKDGKKLIQYAIGKTELTFNIPNSVTSIWPCAFYGCKSLTKVTISNSVTSIGWSAFSNCSNLTSIIIPDGVTSIEDEVFSNCSNLTSVIIPDGVTSIGAEAFYNCSSLTSIVIPDSVTSIGTEAFDNCISLTIYCEIESKPSDWRSGWWNSSNCPVVWDCDNNDIADDGYIYTLIDGIRYGIKDDVATVRRQASGISTVKIQSSIVYRGVIYNVTSIGSNAFHSCKSLISITIPNSITSIGSSAFYNCVSLTNITIPNSTTSIGYQAFYNCASLTSITIPSSVTSISSDAFSWCSSLTIYCEAESRPSAWNYGWNDRDSTGGYDYCPVVWGCDNNDVANNGYIYTVVDGVQYGIKDGVATVVRIRKIATANIPSSITYKGISYSVTNISDDALGDTYLTSIIIPSSVTSIGSRAFYGCTRLTNIKVAEDNPNYKDIDGNLYSKDGKKLIQYAIGKTNLTFNIPDCVTNIGSYAFENCSGLTSIIIPECVTSINEYAFYSCSGLTEIVIPDNVTSIGIYAFYNCSSLTSIIIPDCVTSIGIYAFYNCSSLTSIIIPDCVTSIGSNTFYNCSSLTEIIIPDSVTSIGYYAFRNCSSLTSIVIPDSVTSTGSYAFSGCSSLTKVNYLGSIDDWAQIEFGGGVFSSISELYINDVLVTEVVLTTATKISGYAFANYKALSSITIGDSVTSIGSEAFYNCSLLETVSFVGNSQLVDIYSSAFKYCSSLTSIVIPNSVTYIAYDVFYGCDSLTSITFEDTSTWYRTTEAIVLETGTLTIVTDASANATYFKSTYSDYSWYKK